MKTTVALKVSVALAIFAAASGAAVATANAANRLRDFSWAITPLFLLGGLAVLYAIVTAFFARSAEEQTRMSTNSQSQHSENCEPEKQAEDASLEDLLGIFDGRTEIQSQLYVRRWLGKRVRLNARVWDVCSSLDRSEFMVSLMTADGFSNCHFFIPKTQLNDYAHFRRGTKITIVGTIAKLTTCDLQLEAVQLVKVEDQPVA